MKTLSLRSIITTIGAAVDITTAVSLLAGYFVSGYFNLPSHLNFKAGLNADLLAKYINSHSTLWQFQSVRIAELLGQTDGSDTTFQKRVVEPSNKVVFEEGDVPVAPTIVTRRTVLVAGSSVGQVEL